MPRDYRHKGYAYDLGRGHAPLRRTKKGRRRRLFTRKEPGRSYEEYAVVLDITSDSRGGQARGWRLQLLGENHLGFLEAAIGSDGLPHLFERVCVGRAERREYPLTIIGRLHYRDLTPHAKNRLGIGVRKILERKQDKVVSFFNKAKPVSAFRHELELLHITKAGVQLILDERERSAFVSLSDIAARTGIVDPIAIVTARVITELEWDT